MKLMGKVGLNRVASTRYPQQRISTLGNDDYSYCETRKSPFGKLQRDDSVLYSKAGLSTQDTYSNDIQRTQTDELMTAIGLGCLVGNSKPTHKRTSTEISNLSQFENVDEDIEEKPFEFNESHIKKATLPNTNIRIHNINLNYENRDQNIMKTERRKSKEKWNFNQKTIPDKHQEDDYDHCLEYLPTEHLDGGFNLQVHPHCLTGAKGFETSNMLAESLVFKEGEEEFEDLLVSDNKWYDNYFRTSNQLSQLDELSDDSQDVCKLALDTEEDEAQKPNFVNEDKYNNCQTGVVSTRVSVINSMIYSPKISSYLKKAENLKFLNPLDSHHFQRSIRLNQTSINELESVLQQSPEKISTHEKHEGNTEFDKLDNEILITAESNEYEIEECSVFDQHFDERKTYQWLFKNGALIKKQRIAKKKQGKSNRTSIKYSVNSLSAQSHWGYSSQSLRKTKQRSSNLLKQKVKEIANKMSGKKMHSRQKSRNYDSQGWSKNKTSKKGELESIPEFNSKFKRNQVSKRN